MLEVIYVIGVFDLFHRGHVELLKRSKALGSKLIVAVNGDEMVASYKRVPFVNEDDRLAVVQACRYVDEAFIVKQYDNKEFILKYGVTKIIHGDDWERHSYLAQICVSESFLEENNCEIVLLPYTKGISTSDLIKKISSS